MFDIIKIRKHQGRQYIPDIKAAEVRKPFRGFPLINNEESVCAPCRSCADVCPSQAISFNPLSIDMGKCVFCGDCERACAKGFISFSNLHKISADDRNALVVDRSSDYEKFFDSAIKSRKEITALFGRSLKLRQVSAAGCNGCEMELNACSNVNFDMGRCGIDIAASPRHADGLLITGPVSANMAPALEDAYRSVPDPKIVILVGACAISGGIFHGSDTLNREFFGKRAADLYIPGCPVHPLTVINGILRFIGR